MIYEIRWKGLAFFVRATYEIRINRYGKVLKDIEYIPIMALDTVSGQLQVKVVAGSLVLRITNLSKFLKIKEGDWVEVSIKKLETPDSE